MCWESLWGENLLGHENDVFLMLFKSEIFKVSYTQNVYEIVFEFALINEIS